jgi:predicted enzyme related to lactoylglutathione lyase
MYNQLVSILTVRQPNMDRYYKMKRFNGICILTKDVERLGSFYRDLLQVPDQQDGDNIVFGTQGAEFSIFSQQGMEQMAPGSMEGVGSGCFTIDFEVEDVDAQHELMIKKGIPCIKPPITYPWGRRSAWFRDPDGNILNFYSRTHTGSLK